MFLTNLLFYCIQYLQNCLVLELLYYTASALTAFNILCVGVFKKSACYHVLKQWKFIFMFDFDDVGSYVDKIINLEFDEDDIFI